MVQETGKKFWSTKDPGQQPFSYQAGVGQVIKGWDQGLLGMKLGEERQDFRNVRRRAASQISRRHAKSFRYGQVVSGGGGREETPAEAPH